MNIDLSQLAIERDDASVSRVGSRRHILTRYVLPAGLVLGFLGLIVFSTWRFIVPAKPVQVIPVLVTHSKAQRAGTPLFKAAGWVQPRPTAVRVAALAPGVVEQLLVVEDQLVEKGQLIAKLVDADARLALKHAVAERSLRSAELDREKAGLQAATTRFDQPLHLHAPLAEAQAKLANIHTAIATIPFEIQAAEARQKLAKQDLEGKQKSVGVVSGIQLDEARSKLDTATATLEQLRKRAETLKKERDALTSRRDALSTQLELKADETQAKAEAVARVKAAEAQAEHARVAEEVAQLRVDRMTVNAPIDGRVLHLVAGPGTRLGSGMGTADDKDGSTVVTMYQPEMLQVRVDVRFEDLPRIQLGQPVLIESPAVSSPVDGTVLFISSLADIQKNTLEVKVAIDKPPPVFKPDMLVYATFLAGTELESEAERAEQLRLFVPGNLVERVEGGTFVWVADQDAGVARRVAVEVGPVGSNGLVEVTKGLTAASRLISTGRDELSDGDRIRVTGEDDS
jgi:HlyD family secretion protein